MPTQAARTPPRGWLGTGGADLTVVTSPARLEGVPGFSPRRSTHRTLLLSTLHRTIVLPRDRRRSGRDRVVERPLPRRWPPAGAVGPDCGQRHRRHDGRRCRRPLSARRVRLRPTIPSPAHAAPVASSAVGGRRSLDRRLAGSGGQLMTALAATRRKDCPACPGGHAVAKPVPLGPPAVVRLVRALHPWPPTLSLRGMTVVNWQDIGCGARDQAPTVQPSG